MKACLELIGTKWCKRINGGNLSRLSNETQLTYRQAKATRDRVDLNM